MGYLTGAYLKMQSARMRLQLQHELTSIMSQMNRVTKQIGDVERMFQSKQRTTNAAIQNQLTQGLGQLASREGIYSQSVFNNDKAAAEAQMQKMYNFQVTQQTMQAQAAQAQSVWTEHFELMRQAQLQPLKDLEQSLAMQKANIESRLQLIESQEKAAEKMEKASQSDFTPQYTGQG